MNRKKEGIQGREWSSPKTNITHRGPCPRQLSPNNSKRLRIIQRNLICVKNLTASLCRADVLRREDLFGRFGELLRVLVDKGRWSSSVRVPTKSWDNNVVYILYETETAAANAVKAMHNQVVYDKKIQVSLATTKYCNAFLESGKSQWCDNPYCLYRHETANPEDVVTVDALHSLGLAPPPPHYLFSVKKSRSHSIPPGYYPNSHKPSVYEDSLHSLENNKKFGTNTDSPTSSGWSRSLDSDEPFYLDDNLMEDECNNNKKKNVWDIQNGYWNTTLEPLSNGKFVQTTIPVLNRFSLGNCIETASMLSINGELPPLSEWILLGGNVADMSQSPGLDMYHSKNRMSSRFDFHSEEEEHVSDEESLSPELKNKIFATSNPSADSKASKTPTLLENSEWISPEKRLELMFGNDIVNHFVTLDSLPSLNDLLTRKLSILVVVST